MARRMVRHSRTVLLAVTLLEMRTLLGKLPIRLPVKDGLLGDFCLRPAVEKLTHYMFYMFLSRLPVRAMYLEERQFLVYPVIQHRDYLSSRIQRYVRIIAGASSNVSP